MPLIWLPKKISKNSMRKRITSPMKTSHPLKLWRRLISPANKLGMQLKDLPKRLWPKPLLLPESSILQELWRRMGLILTADPNKEMTADLVNLLHQLLLSRLKLLLKLLRVITSTFSSHTTKIWPNNIPDGAQIKLPQWLNFFGKNLRIKEKLSRKRTENSELLNLKVDLDFSDQPEI